MSDAEQAAREANAAIFAGIALFEIESDEAELRELELHPGKRKKGKKTAWRRDQARDEMGRFAAKKKK